MAKSAVWGWLGDRRLRTKILVPVVLAILGTGIVTWTGLAALGTTGQEATDLYSRSALPLADLAQTLDMLGDAAAQARDLAVTPPGSAQTDLLSEIRQTDQDTDAALSAFVSDHGGALDASRSALLTSTHGALNTWRQVRDSQVAPAASHGDTAAALRAVSGPLAEADDAFSDPLDKLFDKETAAAAAQAAEVRKVVRDKGRMMLALGVGAALLAAALGLAIARLVTVPVARMVAVLGQLAEGDLTPSAHTDSRDEIGVMARALDRATQSIRVALSTVSQTAISLDSSSRELSTISGSIAEAAQQSSTQAQSVAAAAHQITQNVTTLAAGSDEMGATTRDIAHNAAEAARVASEAVFLGGNASETIGKLDGSSTQIGTVVKMITTIAEQTNLLALNATIEAARAGDAGKGFAVVASEVKDLAQETAKATENISRLVAAIQSDTGAAVEATSQITGILRRVSEFQTTIASAVEEQTATTTEMSRSVTEAATGSENISRQITAVADQAGATTAGIGQSQESAAHLAELSAQLRQAVAHFIV